MGVDKRECGGFKAYAFRVFLFSLWWKSHLQNNRWQDIYLQEVHFSIYFSSWRFSTKSIWVLVFWWPQLDVHKSLFKSDSSLGHLLELSLLLVAFSSLVPFGVSVLEKFLSFLLKVFFPFLSRWNTNFLSQILMEDIQRLLLMIIWWESWFYSISSCYNGGLMLFFWFLIVSSLMLCLFGSLKKEKKPSL